MNSEFVRDLKHLTGFAREYYREIAVVSLASLLIVLNHHHRIENFWISSFIYYAVIPVAAILILLRKNPLRFGLGIGNYSLWIPYVLIFLVIAVPVLYITSDVSSVEKYYGHARDFDLLTYSLRMAVYFLGWEFLFRGFMLFGLRDKFGEGSILIQMIPFVLLHLGKPEIETVSTIFTGLLWGYICYRGNSFWPAYIMHMVVNVANKAFVMGLI